MKKNILMWDAPEYYHIKKNIDWYWTVWIIAVSLSVTSIIFSNITFGIFIIVATFALSVFAAKLPAIIHYKIDTEGVTIDKKYYPFENLESFGIDTETLMMPKLALMSKKIFMPYIIVPIQNVNIEDVKNFLINYLPEKKHQEPLFHKLIEYLGF